MAKKISASDIRAAERAIAEALEAAIELERLQRLAAATVERAAADTMRAMLRTLTISLVVLIAACGDENDNAPLEDCADICAGGEVDCAFSACECADTGEACELRAATCPNVCSLEAGVGVGERCVGADVEACVEECVAYDARGGWCPPDE